MAGTDELLALDSTGQCRYCREFDGMWPQYQIDEATEADNLQQMAKLAKEGRGEGRYDVVMGVSGGVDSSYLALLCHRLGLRPLMVHFDNGWNSRAAVANIRRIVDKTGFDLETYVIDWPEFRDLQRAFILAGVVDIELVSDNAIVASSHVVAKRHGINTSMRGSNFATEHGTPEAWSWAKYDWRNIKAIHRRFGEIPLRTFPHMGTLRYQLITRLRLGGKILYPLEKIRYSKVRAMQELKAEFGWEYYGGKHYESTFTKFYQAYMLPVKFGVDKRLVHLSALVRIGDITRQEALAEAASPLYEAAELQRDRAFVCKKLGFSEQEFEKMMNTPPKSHLAYGSDQPTMRALIATATRVKKAVLG